MPICLEMVEPSSWLLLVLQAMLSACSDEPNATEKQTVSLSGDLFPATLTPTPSPESKAESGLSSGAKAGIGVGVGCGALLMGFAGFFLFCRRRRQNKPTPEMSSPEAPPYVAEIPRKNANVQELQVPVPKPAPVELGGRERVAELGGYSHENEPTAAELPAGNHDWK